MEQHFDNGCPVTAKEWQAEQKELEQKAGKAVLKSRSAAHCDESLLQFLNLQNLLAGRVDRRMLMLMRARVDSGSRAL